MDKRFGVGWTGMLIGGIVWFSAGAAGVAVNAPTDDEGRQLNTEEADSLTVEKMLDELVVEGYLTSKKTATGEVFRLSDQARQSGDPYLALTEIPLLNVNLASKSVTTQSGEAPLILIDGRMMNSGIDPIDPKFIESVEIIEVPNAKYLKLGYAKVVNIRLIPRPTYIYAELRTRQEVIPHSGLAGGRFEVGKSKFAVSGSLFGDYTVHNPTDYDVGQELENSIRRQSGQDIKRKFAFDGDVLVKWMPTRSDYLSLLVMGSQNFNRSYGNSEGTSESLSAGPGSQPETLRLTTADHSRNDDEGIVTGLYYEHTFADNSILSAFGYHNYAAGSSLQSSLETVGNAVDLYEAGEDVTSNKYHLALDYDTGDKPYGNIAVGYDMTYIHRRTSNNVNPMDHLLRIDRLDTYVHATYTGQTGRLLYMASGGLEYIDLNADGAENAYWRPRAAASINWNAPYGNSLRADYTLTNTPPPMNNLACFNTSANPWLKTEGNPWLRPTENHNLSVSYRQPITGELWLRASADYRVNTNMVDQWLRTENGVAISSWRNNGTWRSPQLTCMASWNRMPVLIGVEGDYIWESFNHSAYQGRVQLQGRVTAIFGKFIIQASALWTNKSYTAIGYTRYLNPSVASITGVWNVTPRIQLMVGMDYWCGVRRSETVNATDGYTSRYFARFTGDSLKPFVLFSWTLRRNSELYIDKRIPL